MSKTTTPRPFTQNSDLRRSGVFAWTLPAFAGRFASDPDRTYNTCPEAGVCARLCYALTGTYRFSNVKAAHEAKLLRVLDHPDEWEADMAQELTHRRYQGRWIRIHDAGDFFADWYLEAWLRLVRGAPGVNFYCYTKAVSRFRRLVEPDPPTNFKWCYSLGGREDHLIDLDNQRHADVFPDAAAVLEAGYADQSESDLLSVLGPARVGIPANRIPHLLKRQGDHTFGSLQRARDAQLAAKRERFTPAA
ncbi:MAG: hypothetical protein HOV68_05380 [Streptomycetaceae bacterium]|nr:hypothetical protein [Streptomycetaceae bacterium]